MYAMVHSLYFFDVVDVHHVLAHIIVAASGNDLIGTYDLVRQTSHTIMYSYGKRGPISRKGLCMYYALVCTHARKCYNLQHLGTVSCSVSFDRSIPRLRSAIATQTSDFAIGSIPRFRCVSRNVCRGCCCSGSAPSLRPRIHTLSLGRSRFPSPVYAMIIERSNR